MTIFLISDFISSLTHTRKTILCLKAYSYRKYHCLMFLSKLNNFCLKYFLFKIFLAVYPVYVCICMYVYCVCMCYINRIFYIDFNPYITRYVCMYIHIHASLFCCIEHWTDFLLYRLYIVRLCWKLIEYSYTLRTQSACQTN